MFGRLSVLVFLTRVFGCRAWIAAVYKVVDKICVSGVDELDVYLKVHSRMLKLYQ